MNSHRARAYIYLLIVAALWGAAGPVIKYTLAGIDPLPFLAYRLGVSALFSLALGILFIALDKTTVLDLTLIGVIGPMIVTAGGAIFFHDHITRREKIA